MKASSTNIEYRRPASVGAKSELYDAGRGLAPHLSKAPGSCKGNDQASSTSLPPGERRRHAGLKLLLQPLLSRGEARKRLRRGTDPTGYGAHSLRAGSSPTPTLRGATDRAIAQQTRHRSPATLGTDVRITTPRPTTPPPSLGSDPYGSEAQRGDLTLEQGVILLLQPGKLQAVESPNAFPYITFRILIADL